MSNTKKPTNPTLAETKAISDAPNIVAVDGSSTYDETLPTLTRTLCERHAEVQRTVDAATTT
jgi:hypothetical protein